MRSLPGGTIFLALFLICTGAPAYAGDSSVSGTLVEVLHTKGVLDDATYNDLKKAGETGGEQALNKKLIEVLHAKGVLDDAAYNDLSAKAEAEGRQKAQAVAMAGAEPASPKSSSSADRPLDKAMTSIEEGFAKLSGDTVKMKIGVLFQAGWLNDDASLSVGVPPNTSTSISTTSSNQFFARRARLIFDGELSPKLGFKISTEYAPTSTILQDAYLWADYIPHATVTVGQTKQPFSLENYAQGIGDIPTINRALISNMMINESIKDTSLSRSSILRDLGVMASGAFNTKIAGLPFGATYAVGAFNGPGRGLVDDNNAKDVVARVTVNPLLAGLNIGGSWAKGKTRHTYAGLAIDKPRDRWGAEVDYNPPFVKGLKLRGEFMWDRRFFSSYAAVNATNTTLPKDGTGADAITAPNLALWGLRRNAHTYGWYALAAYKVDGLQSYWRYLNGFEPVFRYDFMDEDMSSMTHFARDDARYRTTIGLNYYINKYTRLMANYEIIHADGGLNKKSLENIDNMSHHLFTTLVQVKF